MGWLIHDHLDPKDDERLAEEWVREHPIHNLRVQTKTEFIEGRKAAREIRKRDREYLPDEDKILSGVNPRPGKGGVNPIVEKWVVGLWAFGTILFFLFVWPGV